ncbi:MAG TPA: hypothetical protein VG146_00720, partial [Verrucomicrobiae bacterium]|nr:hypothetical protein [Verrucomicrobiae bacterium]
RLEFFVFSFACRVAGFTKISNHFFQLPVGWQCGETGFICRRYSEFRSVVRELYSDYQLRARIARKAAAHARDKLCNAEEHRKKWVESLTF